MVLVTKATLPDVKYLIKQAIAGFFLISMGNGFVAWGEMHVPSGIAAVICSLMPIVVILINLTINREEKPTFPILVGTVLGFTGILLIFSEHLHEFYRTEYIVSVIMIFGAVLGWAGGSVWIKKQHHDINPFINAGLQMFFGGLWLFPLSLMFDDLSTVSWSTESTYSMIYLIVFGSIIAYTCYSYALRKLPMTIVSLYAYINPLVAVLLGWAVLSEPLNARIWLAITITIAGIYIVNKGYQLRDLWRAQFPTNRN